MALIDYIDPITRRIYLGVDTLNASWHPVDLYREARILRRTDETLRPYDNFMRGDGNVDKGGGKATERYFTLLLGTRIVPYDANGFTDITGTLITDDGLEGIAAFDKTSLVNSVDIQYAPKQVEVINLNFDDLVYSSFQNAVWVDANSVYSDAGPETLPNGNAERPVNNIPVAVQIAFDRGFNRLQIRSDLTLDTGDDVRDLELVGKSHVNTDLIVNPGALCLRTVFKEFNISGVLDGESDIFDCTVGDLEYFDGHIHDSKLNGVLKLSGSAAANIDNCAALNMAAPPTLDFNNSSQSLSMPNWSGPLFITNYTSAPTVSGIGVDAGKIMIMASCTAGTLAMSGNGELIDMSGPNFTTLNSMIDGVVVNSLQRSIEYLRPHHAGSGTMFFWDPFAGNDARDGRTVATACKTFAYIHDNLVQAAAHDIVMCVSGNPSGLTVATEAITITKDYTFLRGPGRDFNIVAPDNSTNAITINGRGIEVSGLRVSSSLTSTAFAIDITGANVNFALISNVYIYNSANGINVNQGEYHILDNLKLHHGTGYGGRIGLLCEHIDINDCHIGSNVGDGLIIESMHEVNINNTVIHKNGGYGLNITATAAGVIIDSLSDIFNNTLGDINDLGASTYRSSSDKNTESEIHGWLDTYLNKDNWKGLTPSQDANLTSINTNMSTIDTNVTNVKTVVDTLPTLLDIEASTILAKKADVSVVEAIVNTLPILSDMKTEMVNVQFGGLEITSGNQMIVKDKAGATIAIFDLFDNNGNPTQTAVYKRTVVV